MTQETPPDHPAGPFSPLPEQTAAVRAELVATLAQAPARLRGATGGLTRSQLDTKYRNWTIRQITHHLADSHIHSYIRFKWALTEENPTIKAYEEADWVALKDCREGDIGAPLALLDGVHAKWVQLLELMSEQEFARTFVHPQTGETVALRQALNYYAWHSRHHTAQVLWLRERFD